MFNPFKRSDGTFAPAYAIMLEYGIPQYQPPKKVDGVELSASQYNRWIELATDNGALADRIVTLGKDSSVVNLAATDLAMVQTLISKEISDAYAMAKQMLILEDPKLADAIDQVKELQKDYGKYKR